MEKIAILSCNRLAAYTNLPLGERFIPEAKLVPVKPLGRVETVCLAVSLPLVLSKSNNTSVEPCSCSEYIRCSLAKTK